MKDSDGREYARLADLRKGDKVQVDDGFDCMEPWSTHLVKEDYGGLFVQCAKGLHHLRSQLTTDGALVGIYHVKGE